jgi:glycosyltransferase involved in cell wall biosynthesis
MQTMAQVSVVTTVYQGEAYFDRARSSILEQTFSDFEWIIVEDGSTDQTPELLKKLEEENPRVNAFFPGRLGRAAALNFGVKQASADYIAIHDFDDISYPERLEKQVKHLESRPEVGVTGGYYIINNQIRNEQFIRRPPSNDQSIRRAFAQNIPFAHTLTMFRKRAWEDVNGYPLLDNLIDLGLWLDIANETNWQFSNLEETLGEHFVHNKSFWHRNFEYVDRQHDLAKLQQRAIEELQLPRWMYIYIAGRLLYPYLPTQLKQFVRDNVGSSEEESLSGTQCTDRSIRNREN